MEKKGKKKERKILNTGTEGGNGNPLQYFCLAKFHGQRSLAGYSPWTCKESDTTEHLSANTGRPCWGVTFLNEPHQLLCGGLITDGGEWAWCWSHWVRDACCDLDRGGNTKKELHLTHGAVCPTSRRGSASQQPPG